MKMAQTKEDKKLYVCVDARQQGIRKNKKM